MVLQKFLAHAGIASRRKAEALITEGKIKINGAIVTKLGATVDEKNDRVEYNGQIIELEQDKIYIALNKPVGYISSATSGQGKSVLNLVKTKERIYPVGRLDKNSSGLMLLTNDGELANRITHPKFGSEKEYFIVLDQDLRSEDIKKLERGMKIAGQKIQPVRVVMAKNKSARLILREGINRQIRKMLGFLGYTVIKLKRIRINKLELGELKEGQWRMIDKKEL